MLHTILYYNILQYTTLHYTTLHYTILYTTLHYTTLYYTTLYNILHTTLYYTRLVNHIYVCFYHPTYKAICNIMLLNIKNLQLSKKIKTLIDHFNFKKVMIYMQVDMYNS